MHVLIVPILISISFEYMEISYQFDAYAGNIRTMPTSVRFQPAFQSAMVYQIAAITNHAVSILAANKKRTNTIRDILHMLNPFDLLL